MNDTDLPLVMIWRRSSDLAAAKKSASEMLSLKLIGEEEDKVMYDAGSVMLAFWGQSTAEEQLVVASETLIRGTAVGGLAIGGAAAGAAAGGGGGPALNPGRFANIANQCGGLNLLQVPLVTNPAMNMRFFMNDVAGGPGATLSAETGGIAANATSDELGESLPFYDDDGNLFSVAEPDQPVTASADLGNAVTAVRDGRDGDNVHLAVTTLLVSNVVASAEFYRETLGFKQISAVDGVASFDVGHSILRLKPEDTPRTVRSLFKSGRLNGDWLVFHTANIEGTVKRLQDAGVEFPLGIEASATGKLAFFTDPDGVSLVLWEPPANRELPEGYINFFPVLDRLLS